MKIKTLITILALASISLLPAMGHDPRPLARIAQILGHLVANHQAIPFGQAPGVRLDPDVVIGKHKHLFNFVCAKIVGALTE
jgi:hypothetical protein